MSNKPPLKTPFDYIVCNAIRNIVYSNNCTEESIEYTIDYVAEHWKEFDKHVKGAIIFDLRSDKQNRFKELISRLVG